MQGISYGLSVLGSFFSQGSVGLTSSGVFKRSSTSRSSVHNLLRVKGAIGTGTPMFSYSSRAVQEASRETKMMSSAFISSQSWFQAGTNDKGSLWPVASRSHNNK